MKKSEDDTRFFPLGPAGMIHTNIEKPDDDASSSEKTAHFHPHVWRQSNQVQATKAANVDVPADNNYKRDGRSIIHSPELARDGKLSSAALNAHAGRVATCASPDTSYTPDWRRYPSELANSSAAATHEARGQDET